MNGGLSVGFDLLAVGTTDGGINRASLIGGSIVGLLDDRTLQSDTSIAGDGGHSSRDACGSCEADACRACGSCWSCGAWF